MKKNSNEYQNFTNAMIQIMKVTHSEIKAKLDAEKAARKRKKAKKSSASREANDRA